MNIECPSCGAKTVNSRQIIHKSGTSRYFGKSSNWGMSFSRKYSRNWFGFGRRSGVRQNILAAEAAPWPLFPPFLILLVMGYFAGVPGALFTIAVWAAISFCSHESYQNEWLCKRCGTHFIPPLHDNLTAQVQTAIVEPAKITATLTKDISVTGKSCSICNKCYELAGFHYGNKSNRSYCQQCSKEEKAAYVVGGAEAARQYRERKRSKWKNVD